MKELIYYRPIEKRDYESLEKLIIHTWGYEKFCSPKTARRMARLYLTSCLMEQTFTCVALRKEEAIGIIMCNDTSQSRRTRIKYVWRMLLPTLAMACTKEGRRISKMFSNFYQIDKDLLKQSGEKYDGTLAFFALRNDQRGTGIGKALWMRGLDYMRKQRISRFYLYTDTTCNYGFYEHHGMKRICEQTVSLKPYYDNAMNFFLYSYSFVKVDIK